MPEENVIVRDGFITDFLRYWKHSGLSSTEKDPCCSLTRRLSGWQDSMHNTRHVSAAGITHRLVQRASSSDPRRSPDLLYTTHHQSGGRSMGLQEEKPLSGSVLHVLYCTVSSATVPHWQEDNVMYLQYRQPQLQANRMITISIFSIINHTRRLREL